MAAALTPQPVPEPQPVTVRDVAAFLLGAVAGAFGALIATKKDEEDKVIVVQQQEQQ